jgi:hypothetical protein
MEALDPPDHVNSSAANIHSNHSFHDEKSSPPFAGNFAVLSHNEFVSRPAIAPSNQQSAILDGQSILLAARNCFPERILRISSIAGVIYKHNHHLTPLTRVFYRQDPQKNAIAKRERTALNSLPARASRQDYSRYGLFGAAG